MRASSLVAVLAFSTLATSACQKSAATGSGGGDAGTAGGGGSGYVPPAWMPDARVLVSGETTNNDDCRTDVCRHSENTDLINWQGAIFLVHRTAESQVLGPNSSLRVSRSDDGGKTFALQAVLPAPTNRDIRDPHFYVVGNQLVIKTLCRLAVNSTRDSNVDTLPQTTTSTDGKTWSALATITDGGGTPWNTHSFWRIKQQGGVYYSAAYLDGDLSVTLFSSADGVSWQKGADIYTVSADTPLETELTFMPSGKLLALVRTDGNDDELLGSILPLRTSVCWADPPYTSFSCPQTFMTQRLDGPLSFFHDGRLFVVARKHLIGPDDRKRTSLFEITGTLEGGPIDIKEWGELPSAGDTSYAGVATVDGTRSVVSWYSGDLTLDEGWATAIFLPSDIWVGTLDFSKLQ
jgi:hypothetical protein